MALRRPEQLATLLRIRQRQEDLRAQDLAATQRDLQAAARERAKLILARRQAMSARTRKRGEVLDASSLRRQQQYERYLARRADEKDAEMRELKTTAESKRVELEHALKQRRMVERLYEQRRDALRTEHAKAEQRLLDDVGQQRAARGTDSAPDDRGARP